MKNIFVKHLDKPTSNYLIQLARQHGYDFYGPCNTMDINALIDYFYNQTNKN